MGKHLCTFSGKFGDILWSLPTAKYIAEKMAGGRVDFAVMPYYKSLLPLLVEQSYIEHAYVIEGWLRTHSNHGDQPWEPPVGHETVPYGGEGEKYEKCWHLTYKGHPGISAPAIPLVEFIAYQQGISFQNWQVVPFLEVGDEVGVEAEKVWFGERSIREVIEDKSLVTVGFNEQYAESKERFYEELWRRAEQEGFQFLNVSDQKLRWCEAAWCIKNSVLYVGCRSAGWVLANGLGKVAMTFEPHPSRHASGHLGKIFGNRFGAELALPFGLPERESAGVALDLLRKTRESVRVPIQG